MAKQHTTEADKAKVDTDQLIADFKALVADAEALLHATADQGGEGVEKIRAQAQDSLAQAKANLNDLQEDLSAKAKAMAAGADQFVHQKPWESVGLAAGLGLLIGLLISRR
ncbi:MAG: DUF883 family protein [Polynucleobacter sp.]|nr:DUF883 family protein [Polynucleobacter sp.]MDZ4055938.1 DUF883 family protein [Polynucleobacter sp.]